MYRVTRLVIVAMFGKFKALLFDNLTSLFLQNKLQNTPSTKQCHLYFTHSNHCWSMSIHWQSVQNRVILTRSNNYLLPGPRKKFVSDHVAHESQLTQPMWSNLDPLFLDNDWLMMERQGSYVRDQLYLSYLYFGNVL